MANRRMFSKTVISSARFLRMPASSRLLYYDLGMEADDDGVVEAFTVMRTTGACEDDLRVLVARGFVRVLTDDLVTVICDWNINNQLRKDRYTPSLYKPLLLGLEAGTQMETVWKPNGNQMEPQYSIGKDSIVEDNKTMSGKPDGAASFCREVVDFLNETAGKSYRASTKATVKVIKAKMKEGFTLDDFKKVIMVKTPQWKGTNMDGYLRPETLFGPHFESYLQEAKQSPAQEPPKQADIDWSMIDYIPEEART